MADVPLAFLYFWDDFEASQALQFCHDNFLQVTDFFERGWKIIAFFSLVDFEECRTFCRTNHFAFKNYMDM